MATSSSSSGQRLATVVSTPSAPVPASGSVGGLIGGGLALVGLPLAAWFMGRREGLKSERRQAGAHDGGDMGGRSGGVGSKLRGAIHERCAYLDYNATTPIFPEVASAMEPFLWEHFGNPSSGHAFARPCKEAVDEARSRVAGMLGCDADEVIFTSCGSEADNHAVASAVDHAVTTRGIAVPHVVTCEVEHPAILEYLAAMQASGRLTYTAVGVNGAGVVDPAAVASAVKKETCLVTVMHANNEVGAVQPVSEISKLVKSANPDVVVHTDAAQSCGKIPVKVRELGVDYCTIVGHKIGAPKGVAALYVRRDAPFAKLLHGGGQEAGRRAGTENVMHIVGLGAACALVEAESASLPGHLATARDRLQETLVSELAGADGAGVRVNGPEDDALRLPNTLSVGIRGVSASVLLTTLADRVAASAGAACHTGDAAASISSVLRAMDVPEEYAVGTLRLSVGRHTTVEDVVEGGRLIVEAARGQLDDIAAMPEGQRPAWCVRNVFGGGGGTRK